MESRGEVKRVGLSKVPAFATAGVGVVGGIAAVVLDTVFPEKMWSVMALVAGISIGWALAMYRLTIWTQTLMVHVEGLKEAYEALLRVSGRVGEVRSDRD